MTDGFRFQTVRRVRVDERLAGHKVGEWSGEHFTLGHLQPAEVERLPETIHQLLVLRSLEKRIGMLIFMF